MAFPTDDVIFTWLDELCQEAKGDVMLLNRLGVNAAFSYYFNNVYTLKSVSPKTYAAMQWMTEARRWHGEYMEAEERKAAEIARDEKIAALESQVAKLVGLLESQAKAEPDKKKPGKIKQDEMDSESE